MENGKQPVTTSSMLQGAKGHSSIFDLILCLSQAVDFINPRLNDHHNRVAYVAYKLSEALGLPLPQREELAIAGAVHDIGALSLKERIDLLEFEENNASDHSNLGYLLLKTFSPFSEIASLVRFHHVPWGHGDGHEVEGTTVPMGSHLLHLADRISVLIDPHGEILKQVPAIIDKIDRDSGIKFMPELVDSFKGLAAKEYFWFDIVSPSTHLRSMPNIHWESIELNDEHLFEMTNLFRRVIDFRSSFTATHSSGVASCAKALSRIAGFSEDQCRIMLIAGYLHDLGKLAVPKEILEKAGKLSGDEFDVIRHHTYYTDRILRSIPGFDLIRNWGASHHERLDGAGYPFHLKGDELSLGARIMAVADVFVAVTEDRPYRKGMSQSESLQVLEQMTNNSALDAGVVSMLKNNFDELNAVRAEAQSLSTREYQGIISQSELLQR